MVEAKAFVLYNADSESELQEADPLTARLHGAQQNRGDQAAVWALSQQERHCARPSATLYQPHPANRDVRMGAELPKPYPASWSVACRPLHPVPPALQQTRAANHRLVRHPGHMSKACEPRCVEDVHKLGNPRRRAHLSCRVEGAVRPSAHTGDPAQVGIVGSDKGLQLLVCEAAGLWHTYSVDGLSCRSVTCYSMQIILWVYYPLLHADNLVGLLPVPPCR
eukprot:359876-Chlamydomonas_euryale.AAC.7